MPQPLQPPLAPYLTGPRLALRAVTLADAADPMSWLDRPVPITPAAAERIVIESEIVAWGNAPSILLIAAERQTGHIVGSVTCDRENDRIGKVTTFATPGVDPDKRDEIESEMLEIVLRWALAELDLMTVTVGFAADRDSCLDTAVRLGMREAVRVRERIRRPDCRIDLITYEIVNPVWATAIAQGQCST